MRNMRECDVLVIGAGPGGLGAAKGAKEAGAKTVIVLERGTEPGGILNQCIHDGFGLIRYGETLTGPEYAARVLNEATGLNVEILTERHVKILSDDKTATVYAKTGIEKYHARAIVLATGCRERTRGVISTPGSHPAGVFTAGVVQNLINRKNVMIGKRVVILGSGDIGLIVARRLTLEGAKVLAIAEIMSEPCGLSRNVSQCVYEFNIPLYVNTTVTNIIGKKKLEAVELSEVDENQRPIKGTARHIECDALVLSVGLIPENEVAQTVGLYLNADNSVQTDEFLQSSVSGIFSCGNSRHVMDLADYVSEQGELAGKNAVSFIKNSAMEIWDEKNTNCMKKGFPEKDTLTCTICPNGCQVKRDEVSGKYFGNKCLRGVAFVEQERTDPKRTVTTTVRSVNIHHPLIAVKTLNPVKRDAVFDVVQGLKGKLVECNTNIGNLIATFNIEGIDIPIIATENSWSS